MAELRTSLRIDLTGDLPAEARRFARAIQDFADGSTRHIERMNRPLHAMSAQLGQMANRWTALASGAALAATVKQIADLEHRITMLSINAQTTPAQAAASKEALFAVARQPDIRLRPENLLAAEEKVVEVTGDVKFAEANRRNMGLLMRATDAQGEAVGALFGELNKANINTEADVMQVIDTLNVQGKSGAFTIKDMANLGPRFVNALGARRKVDVAAMRDAGAALQVMMMGIGTADPTVTAFQAILGTLSDDKKVTGTKSSPGIQRDWGVDVWDPAAKKAGKMEMRPLTDILREIIMATKGDPTQLGQVFPAEALPGMNFLTSEYKATGRFDTLDKLLTVKADGTQTKADAGRAAQDTSAIVEGLGAAVAHAADKYGSPMVRGGSNQLDKLTVGQQDTAIAGGSVAVGSLLGSGLLAQLSASLGAGALATFSAGASVLLGAGVAPAVAGATVGSVAYDRGLSGTTIGDEIGEAVAQVLATFGSQNAKDSLARAGAPEINVVDGIGALLDKLNQSLSATLATIGSGAPAGGAAPTATVSDAAVSESRAASDAAVSESRAASEAAASESRAASEAAQAQATAASEAAQAAATAASQEAQATAAAAAALALSAATQATAAAATVAKGIHGEIRIVVSGPAQVTSVSATGPVDVTAQGPYTGQSGTTP